MGYEFLDTIVATIDYYNHRERTPNWCIEDATIDFVDITYIVNGQAEYTVDGQKYVVSAGDLLYIPSGSRRSAFTYPNSLVESYCINGMIRNIDGEDINLPFPMVSKIGVQKDIISLYSDLTCVWHLRDPGYHLKARAIYLMILQRYLQLIVYQKDTNITDKRIKKALHYMTTHYQEPLSVQKMAELVNLSNMYFGNLFKQETGMSFHKFLTSIRLNRAEDMLYSGEYKINEIADACGFSDVFYFSRLFKESRGFAPSNVIRSRKEQSINE